MEIRARISLEVAKFVANTKVVAAQFKAMGVGAERFSKNVDHYSKRSLDQTKSAGVQRVADQSRVGKAILAQEQKLADDRRSVIMAGVRRSEKDRNKLELDAISKGGTGQVTGAVRPPRQKNPAYAKERDESKVLTAEMIKDINKRFDAREKSEKKAAALIARESAKSTALIARESAKTTAIIERQNARASKAIIRHYEDAAKASIKFAAQQKKAADMASNLKYFNSQDFTRQLASMRYAMYDVSRRATAFGLAVGAAVALAVKSAIDFESAFTSVERTTQLSLTSNIPSVVADAQALRDTLVQLTTEIPIAFADVANIATLGAQMGIASDQVDEFAETVAKFSSITKIGAEDVALSFGRIAQLTKVPSDQFENLSSAIAFTGVNSVATDREILRMSESIAASATAAGFAADETIGFASALASLKIRPEEARGVLLRLFRDFEVSVSQGGSKLDDLARILSTTSEKAANIWKQDPSEFVQAFLKGANAGGELNKVLLSLGITNTREARVVTSLANNMGVLEQALSDSKEQFESATFSTEAYGLVVDDIASKITMLKNGTAALGASFGEELLPFIGFVVDSLRNLVDGFSNLGPGMKTLILGVTALTAGLALLVGGAAATIAGLFAVKQLIVAMGARAGAATLGVGAFRAMIISLIPGSAGATGVLNALGLSAANTGRAFTAASFGVKAFTLSLGVIGIVAIAAAVIADFASSASRAKEESQKFAKAALEAAGGFEAFKEASVLEAGEEPIRLITGAIEQLTDAQVADRRASLEAEKERTKLNSATEDGKEAYEKAEKRLADFNDEIERGKGLTNEATIAITENTRQLYINALAKIDNGEGGVINLFETIAELTPETRAQIEKSGVDISKLLNDSVDVAMVGGDVSKVIQEAFTKVYEEDPWFITGSKDAKGFFKALNAGADAFEGINTGLALTAGGAEVLSAAFGDAGSDAEGAAEGAIDLNAVLKETIGALTLLQRAEGGAASALDTFAQGAIETGGAMDGLGEAARTNLSNFASFMESAAEAAIAAGEGTPGAIRRIIGGLEALDAAGVNTKAAFGLVRDNILGSIISMGNGSVEFRAEIAKAYDLSSLKELIKAFYEVRMAAASSPDEFRLLRDQMDRSLAGLKGASFDIKPFTSTTKSAEKALTALEKLKAMIDKLFKSSNNRLDVLNSVDSLGEALKKNGTVFSVWTKAGRDNISSLRSTLDTLAESSNGNTQVFSNSLGALRQALVRAGVSGTGLKDIDNLIKKTGKTSKVSKNQVTQFYAQIRGSSEARRALLEIADAASKVSSAINAGLSATFAQGNAIDQVTLGWLDLADAQDAARKAVSGANEAIVEANLSIRAAKASIDELTADSGKLQFQLQIAIKYGDTLREDAIRAQLGTIDAEIASKENDITKANSSIANSVQEITDANSKLGIDSNTRDLIAQNLALQDMASKYGTVTAFMLATAKPGTDLNGIIEAQTKAFYDNAIQMGYTETDAKTLSDVLRTELIASMDDIPEDIATTIKADTTGALAAVTKFANDANARLATIKDKTVTVTTIERTVSQSSQGSFKGRPVNFYRGGLVSGPGGATSDSIPARLSSGEFVVRASAVSRHGVDFFNSLNNMQSAPSRMLAAPAQSSGGSQTVFLSTEDRQLLRSAINRPVALYTDNATIAKSANDGNAILAQRGIR